MTVIIDDNDVCDKCGAYWQGNGFCCNGHPRISMLDVWAKYHDEYLEMFDTIERLKDMHLLVGKWVEPKGREPFIQSISERELTGMFCKKHGIDQVQLEQERSALLDDCRFRNWTEDAKKEIARQEQ